MKFNQAIGFSLGGFTVGNAATMTRSKAIGTIVGVEDRGGRRIVTVEFDEPQPVDVPEGATSKRFELTHTNITSTWAKPVSDREVLKFAAGEWNHLFGVGSKETRCRIVIDLEESKLIAAQEWTGLKFMDIRGDALKDLSESVIEVNEAHVNLDDWNSELTSELPEWAAQREMSNYIEPSSMTAETKSSLADGEVLGRDADGGLIQWDAATGAPYNSGQTVDEFGLGNLSEPELKRLNPQFATGNWMHLFGTGSKETRCRIVIDLQQCKLVAAQEWTGFKFEDIRGDRLGDLAESVIEVNEAHVSLDDWNSELTSEMPVWAAQREVSNCIEQPAAHISREQQEALAALQVALSQATDSGLFGELAAHAHPDRINAFCDDVHAFAQVSAPLKPSTSRVVQGNVANSIEQPTPTTSVAPDTKLYRAEVHGGGDLDVAPSVALFQVDEQLARDIIKFASLVKANDVYKIERFDYRAEFLQYDPETAPEDAEEAGEDNSVRTDCDCLVVTDSEFFFRAYVKHTDVGVECRGQSISDLAKHFGLQFGEPLQHKAISNQLEQALPGFDDYEKGYKDALESIAFALATKVAEPILGEAITTALDAYANNSEHEMRSQYDSPSP